MAGTLTVTWQNLPKDNLVMHNHAGWHSAKQIHPDTSLAAQLNPASSNQNFPVPKARHIQLCNVVLAGKTNTILLLWVLHFRQKYKITRRTHLRTVSQNHSLDKMFLYPQGSNISTPSVSMFITRLLENKFLSFC